MVLLLSLLPLLLLLLPLLLLLGCYISGRLNALMSAMSLSSTEWSPLFRDKEPCDSNDKNKGYNSTNNGGSIYPSTAL